MRDEIRGVIVNYPDDMSSMAAELYVLDEINNNDFQVGVVNIWYEDDEVVIESKEWSPITRVRRITGYCSKIQNFNPGKQAELKSRVTHVKARGDK